VCGCGATKLRPKSEKTDKLNEMTEIENDSKIEEEVEDVPNNENGVMNNDVDNVQDTLNEEVAEQGSDELSEGNDTGSQEESDDDDELDINFERDVISFGASAPLSLIRSVLNLYRSKSTAEKKRERLEDGYQEFDGLTYRRFTDYKYVGSQETMLAGGCLWEASGTSSEAGRNWSKNVAKELKDLFLNNFLMQLRQELHKVNEPARKKKKLIDSQFDECSPELRSIITGLKLSLRSLDKVVIENELRRGKKNVKGNQNTSKRKKIPVAPSEGYGSATGGVYLLYGPDPVDGHMKIITGTAGSCASALITTATTKSSPVARDDVTTYKEMEMDDTNRADRYTIEHLGQSPLEADHYSPGAHNNPMLFHPDVVKYLRQQYKLPLLGTEKNVPHDVNAFLELFKSEGVPVEVKQGYHKANCRLLYLSANKICNSIKRPPKLNTTMTLNIPERPFRRTTLSSIGDVPWKHNSNDNSSCSLSIGLTCDSVDIESAQYLLFGSHDIITGLSYMMMEVPIEVEQTIYDGLKKDHKDLVYAICLEFNSISQVKPTVEELKCQLEENKYPALSNLFETSEIKEDILYSDSGIYGAEILMELIDAQSLPPPCPKQLWLNLMICAINGAYAMGLESMLVELEKSNETFDHCKWNLEVIYFGWNSPAIFESVIPETMNEVLQGLDKKSKDDEESSEEKDPSKTGVVEESSEGDMFASDSG